MSTFGELRTGTSRRKDAYPKRDPFTTYFNRVGDSHRFGDRTLPASAAVDVTKKPLLKAFFRSPPDVNRLDDLYGTTRGKVQHISIVSNCNMDVLKAFLATGWAPIILSKRSSKGYLTAVMGYDDADQQIQVGNPLSAQRKGLHTRAGRTLTYSEFEKEWATGSGNKCVLITPKRLHDVEIHAALKKYLPKEQVAQIRVRSR